MPVVYVVHDAVFDGKPVKDYSSAEKFGTVRVLVRTRGRSGTVVVDTEGFTVRTETVNVDADVEPDAARAVVNGLAGYTSDDYLLLVGSPKLIAVAGAAAAAAAWGYVRFLVWDARYRRYEPSEVQVWGEAPRKSLKDFDPVRFQRVARS